MNSEEGGQEISWKVQKRKTQGFFVFLQRKGIVDLLDFVIVGVKMSDWIAGPVALRGWL